jgi:hypothetical protein
LRPCHRRDHCGKTESPGGARELLDDKNEKIGVVDDLIITPDKSVLVFIGAGGLLGMAKHDGAIPVS